MHKNKLHIVWAVIAVVALAGGFFWGKSMASSGSAGRGAFASPTRGGFAGRGAGANGGFVAGTVSSIDSQSITIQLANGNSQNVFYSSSTQVIVPQTASIASVTPGTTVIIGGTTDSSGNLTASSIQIRNGNTPGGPGGFNKTNTGGNQPQPVGQY